LQQYGEKYNFNVDLWYRGEDYPRIRRISKHIIKLTGSINCLIYVKARSKKPYFWGVTANRLEEIKQSGKPWAIVLLCETAQTGYFLTANDTSRYITESIWPLSIDGDCKVSPSKLRYNIPFSSFNEFIELLLELFA